MRSGAEPYPEYRWPTDLSIALSPDQTFGRLITNTPLAPARRLATRLLLALVTIAIVVPVMAVQRVSGSLVATAALSWSFIVVIQVIVALGVIVSSRTRRRGLVQSLELWFAGHLPYSLWMLTVAVVAANVRGVGPLFLFATALVPAAWTAVIVVAFCRRVLNDAAPIARRRAAAHQAIVWTIALGYAALTSGGWFQITASVARLFR